MASNEEMRITRIGDPSKPQGEEGKMMLNRMNQSHYEVTGWALSHWNLNSDDEVLDIGCGGGMTLSRLSKEIISGHLTGVDYSLVSVEESSKLNKEDIENGKMKVLYGNVESLPFNDDSFNKIITVESFYFWPNHLENLKEVKRVLKENGIFMLVADIYDNGELDEQTLANIKEFNLFNPSIHEFVELFFKAGFKNIKVYTKHTWICVLGQK